MTDKRTPHTDALDTLGQIIGPNEKRDAIHLAVEPVKAASWLTPGLDVGRYPDGSYGPSATKLVGIVDPFLNAPVEAGETFWLLVYPRQITSLRHVWEHPDFPVDAIAPSTTESASLTTDGQRGREAEQAIYLSDSEPARDGHAAAVAKLEGMAETVGISYTELINAAEDYLRRGYYLIDGGKFDEFSSDDRFWDAYSIVTGNEVPDYDRGNFFSCSC